MPKEVIRDASTFSSDFPTQELIAELRWSRDGDIQLATKRVEVADNSSVWWNVEGGWHINLNRRTVNDLIRNLRKARDQAFGKDE